MRRVIIAAAAAVCAGLVATSCFADLSPPDRSFATAATHDSISEVQDAQWANKVSQPSPMKLLAQRIIRDNSAAISDLHRIAEGQNFTLPTLPTAQQMSERTNLKNAHDQPLQQDYVRHEVTRLQQTIALYRQELRNGKDQALKLYVQHYLPVLSDELQQAKTTGEQLGVGRTG